MQIKLMIPNYVQLQLHATRVANILEFHYIFLAQWAPILFWYQLLWPTFGPQSSANQMKVHNGLLKLLGARKQFKVIM